MKYNMNGADPLAADYNNNAVSLAEGDIAFWFNETGHGLKCQTLR